MSSADRRGEAPERPRPRLRLSDMVADRIRPVETGRLIAIAAATLGVVLAGIWLLRAPPPSVEATLSTVPDDSPVTLPEGLRPPTPRVIVHVAGAVPSPGVHELVDGARVVDAIAAAGGVLPEGQPDRLNLAAVLVDGQRIHVPIEGEPVQDVPAGAGATPGPINLNAADPMMLESLPGIGPATATAIIDDREANGPFRSVDDLDRVAGIGPATVERLRSLVTT